MLHKIYRASDNDGEFSWLSDRRNSHSDTCIEVGFDDVTLDELVRACDDDFENANYHGFVGATGLWVDAVTAVAGEDVAKRVLWDIVTKHSFLWSDNL